jgi:hypothetical protein
VEEKGAVKLAASPTKQYIRNGRLLGLTDLIGAGSIPAAILFAGGFLLLHALVAMQFALLTTKEREVT